MPSRFKIYQNVLAANKENVDIEFTMSNKFGAEKSKSSKTQTKDKSKRKTKQKTNEKIDTWKMEKLAYFNAVDEFELAMESDSKPIMNNNFSVHNKSSSPVADDFLEEELKSQPQPQPSSKVCEPTHTTKLSVQDILHSSHKASLPPKMLSQLSQPPITQNIAQSLVNELDNEMRYVMNKRTEKIQRHPSTRSHTSTQQKQSQSHSQQTQKNTANKLREEYPSLAAAYDNYAQALPFSPLSIEDFAHLSIEGVCISPL